MNIIFVSNNMAKAKTLSLLQVAVVVLALLLLPIIITMLLIVPQTSAPQKGVRALITSPLKLFNQQKHLDAYAVQLGEMQARMMRLDAQSERLVQLAGEKKSSEGKLSKQRNVLESPLSKPHRGGPLVLDKPLSEAELQKRISELTSQIEFQTEHLSYLEARLLQQSVHKNTLPNSSPVAAAYNSSSFGWRLDPFNGHKAFHEGLDFTANVGTPIYAAAAGVVFAAEHEPDYGKIVKVDHGSGLETRYAHASKLFVKVGQRVVRGQKIAEVGNTGRSTGAHLHYEIRLHGNALDPRKYLKNNAG